MTHNDYCSLSVPTTYILQPVEESGYDPRSGNPRKTLAELLSRYKVLPNGCWEWTGTRNKYGYGLVCIMIDGKPTTLTAHRLQWMRFNGPMPEGHEACHDCPDGTDNRACINPDHLWNGTHGENIRDAAEKYHRRRYKWSISDPFRKVA